MPPLAFLSSSILDSTAAGRSLLTAANAAAQRSLLGLGTTDSPTFAGLTAGTNFTIDATGNVNFAGQSNLQINRTNDVIGNNALNLANLFGLQVSATGSDFLFNRRTGGSWSNVITILNSNGNVGLGTTNPISRVEVTDTTLAGSGSLAGSALIVNQTWNTTGTPTAIQLNVTDTASNAASQLVNLRVGGTSLFNIDKAGVVTVAQRIAFDGGAGTSPRLRRLGSTLDCVNNSETAFLPFRAGELWLGSSLALVLDASDILAQRRGAVAQAFRVYNTFTDINNFERAKFSWETNVLRIGTEKFGTGVARALEFQTDGITRMTFTGAGNVTVNAALSVQGSGVSTIGQVTVAGAATQFVFDAAGGSNYTGSSGATSLFGGRSGFAPTSGTMTFTGFLLNSTINQTGGANGITRGIFINPTLTAAADWRAIEVASGITILGPSTTSKASLNIPSGSDPTSPAQGDLWVNTSGDLRYRNASSTITLGSGGGGGVSDGDKGDITVSGSGATWTIDNDAVTYAKIQNVSAASRILGRGAGGGSGDVEELTLGSYLYLDGTVLGVALPEPLEIFTFANIAVSGQSTVSADGSSDTLTLAAGSGISITTNATTDTVTISATGGGGGGGGLSRYTAIALGW